MKHHNVSVDKIRNIGCCAHIDAGKTTVSERILFYSGRSHIMGEVHDGAAILDDDPREQKKGITINSAATTVYWYSVSDEHLNHMGPLHRINLIDTPGHIDFTVEVERSLRVLDGAICILDGSQGVEPQTEQVWRQADRYNVARIIFINKMDKVGADFQMSLDSIREKLGIKAIPIQLPFGEEDKFSGVIDVINMRLISFDDDSLGKKLLISEIPQEYLKQVLMARENLIEALSDYDDDMMLKFLSGNWFGVSVPQIKKALRAATIKRTIYPVLCGSALRNKGVQLLLDAVIDYLPAPCDLPALTEKPEQLAALAFKVVSDKNGDLTFLRIYSGTLSDGIKVYNSSRQHEERIGRLVLMHASKQEPIDSIQAGNIVGVIGFKSTYTGDTICDKKSPLILSKMEFPNPVVELSVEPKTNADQDKLSGALQKLLIEDPSLKIVADEETGQTILIGMGELHLEIVVDKLRNDHSVGVNVGKPRVSYRETITKSGRAEYKHVKQSGGRGQYGHVVLKVSPSARGAGLIFTSEVIGGAIPKEYIPAIEKGIRGAMEKGIIAGFPVTDVEVTVLDGSYHSVDSSANAFEIAGSMCFQQACKNAAPVILEPIMNMEVVAPEQYMGDVIGSISGRGGQIKNTFFRGNARVIESLIPLRNVFGYTMEVRSKTQGRASPSISFSHYDISTLKATDIK